MTIQELCVKHGTDKTPEIAHSYSPVYDKLFKDRKNIKTFVEIGIGTPDRMAHVENYKIGASLYVWRDFFPKARVYGIDTELITMIEDEDRIRTFHADATLEATVKLVTDEIGKIDILVDDGSHRMADQLESAELFLPHMRKGGLYFIEDVKSTTHLARALGKDRLEIFDWTTPSRRDDRLVLIRC